MSIFSNAIKNVFKENEYIKTNILVNILLISALYVYVDYLNMISKTFMRDHEKIVNNCIIMCFRIEL